MTRIVISLLVVIALIQTAAFIELPGSNPAVDTVKEQSTPRTVWRRTVNGWENMNDWKFPEKESELRTDSGYQANTAIMSLHPGIVTCILFMTSVIPFILSASNDRFSRQRVFVHSH